MGGSTSMPLPRYSCCIRQQNPNRCKENHSSTPKFKGHRRNLSAAFNMADIGAEFSVDLIDINRASEEELMTLPGINRQTAHNIVEYRRQIGGFKKVEDLALVSGVGATKLTHIRMEICVGKKKSSQNSSPNSSKVDLSLQDDISRSSGKSQARQLLTGTYRKVNINTSNVFQLMKVKGLNQSLAENIVAYRDKKGQFRHMDEVLKVKGIKSAILSAVRPYLTLVDTNQPRMDTVHLNGDVNRSQTSQHGQRVQNYGHARSLSYNPVCTRTDSISGSQEDLISLYGPLAKKSFRAKKRPVLFRKNNRHVFRLASWNLQHCGLEKAENPGVKEVFAMTVLENGFSIIAIQDLRDEEALDKLCEELNAPTVPNAKKWRGHQGSWKCVVSDSVQGATQGHVGFLYDISRGIECKSIEILDSYINRGKPLDRKPCKAVFKVKDLDVAVINVDWEPHQPDTVIEDVHEAILEHTLEDQDVIILGCFKSEPETPEFDLLRNRGFTNLFLRDNYTDISTHNPEGTRCTNNIWLNQSVMALYTAHHDVVREGLANPWIPDGWGWGGVVSRWCPLWAEFYMDSPQHRANVSNKKIIKESDESEDEFVDAEEKLT